MKPDDAPENFWPQVGDLLSMPRLQVERLQVRKWPGRNMEAVLSCDSHGILLSNVWDSLSDVLAEDCQRLMACGSKVDSPQRLSPV